MLVIFTLAGFWPLGFSLIRGFYKLSPCLFLMLGIYIFYHVCIMYACDAAIYQEPCDFKLDVSPDSVMEDHLRRQEPRRHRHLIQSTPLPVSYSMVPRLEEESMVSPDSPGRLQKCSPMGECQNPVSYTHLTLPTIYSV